MTGLVTSDVRAYFWGGPEDGAERRLPTPLSDTLEITGHRFEFKPEGGEAIKRCKVYRYRHALRGGRHIYTYEGEFIGEEATT